MVNAVKKLMSHDEATRLVSDACSAGDQAWHDAQTRQAIKEADAGDFATTDALKATVRKFIPNG